MKPVRLFTPAEETSRLSDVVRLSQPGAGEIRARSLAEPRLRPTVYCPPESARNCVESSQ